MPALRRRKTADDLDYDDVHACEIMAAAGKAAADLDVDVELLRKRRVWAAGLKEVDQCQESVVLAQQELSKLETERQAAFRNYIDPIENKMRAINYNIDVWQAKTTEHGRSLNSLQNSAPAHLQAKLQSLRSECSKSTVSKSSLKKEAAAARRRIEILEREIPKQERFVKSHKLSKQAAIELKRNISQLPPQREILRKAEERLLRIDIAEAAILKKCEAAENELLIP